MLSRSGAAYDGIDYQNIRFVASGTGATQTWAGDETVFLSATEGVCYGYYPYSSSVTNITDIPVSTAGQVDYLYASPVAVDINNRNVSLTMNHGLAAIRLALKRGTYTGTGVISAVSVTSDGLGTAGTLNAMTGKLSGVTGMGTEIGVSTAIELSSAEQNADVIVVPTGTSTALTLSLTVDGKVYSTTADARIIAQGKCYTYTMTINAGELGLSGVKVGDWGYDDSGAPVIEAAGYKVTFAGDFEGISFSNTVIGATVRIEARERNGWPVKAVSISGDAMLTQGASEDIYIINLLAIKSNVVVTFNGSDNPWNHLADGVYAVGPDLRPVVVEEATSDCIAVAVINSEIGQKLMIEKYEYANSSYRKAYEVYGATGSDYSCFYWGIYGVLVNDLLDITDFPLYTTMNSSYSWGYVPDKNGVYSDEAISKNRNLGLPSEWPNDATRYKLADRSGFHHSQYLMQIEATDEYTTYPKVGQVLKTFLYSDDNLGYFDWYVPALGQIGLFYVYMSDLNKALSAINGTLFSRMFYWSSNEGGIYSGSGSHLNIGSIGLADKNYNYGHVRFVRDL